LRDLGLLQSAVARPQATFDGADLYLDLWHKAAALMESLAQNHPFVDGNKRTAITATAMFLQQNVYVLQTTNEALEAFVIMVVEERPSLDAIVVWLKENVKGR
jgi:death-on-curing protein